MRNCCRHLSLKFMCLPLIAVVVFVVWMFVHPEYLNYHEQNQLFLFTGDYLVERLSVPGGLADWVSEFIVQFFYLPWLGAVMMALLFVAISLFQPTTTGRVVIPLLLLWLMADSEVLLSYSVALLLVLAAYRVMRKQTAWWTDVLVLPFLYWLMGPMTWLYLALRCVDDVRKECFHIVWLLAIEGLSYHFLLPQYPLIAVLRGINYYRIPEHGTAMMWIIPLVTVVLYVVRSLLANRLKDGKASFRIAYVVIAVISFCVIAVYSLKAYDKDTCEALKQDMLIRQGQWQEIIARAEKWQSRNSFSSNAVNLALAKTRQLADRQFDFYQSGDDALIMPSTRDNLSNAPSAEVFYQLGMVQSALRYAFDLQQSVLNLRRSGRWTKRLAECYIVNGQYDVAQRYLDELKRSLFYRSWALEAEGVMHDEKAINRHPEWGRMRRMRFQNDFLFNYGEKDKMFGQLFISNNHNTMALDYFMAQLLLDGKMQDVMQYMGVVQQYGGYAVMPRVYRDAVRLIQSQGREMDSSYGQYARRMMGQ